MRKKRSRDIHVLHLPASWTGRSWCALRSIVFVLLCVVAQGVAAQISDSDFDDGFTVTDNTFNPDAALDSLHASHKEVPKGMRVWTVDEQFGDMTPAERDTVQHLFMNTIFTTGKYGEYNTTGNLGAPRIARIATDRDLFAADPYLEPYGYFLTQPSELRYTNTLSPLTNVFYSTCGNKTDGEDYLRVLFATNVNKRFGVGFKFNYLYGRGYYDDQSTALFDYTFWASYLGERYQAHLNVSFNHMKVAENGGISNDNYITHPEAYKDSYTGQEIPVVLQNNWNNQDAFNLHFTHRYNVGFYRKVEMTEMEKEAKRFALRAKRESEEAEGKSGTAPSSLTPNPSPVGEGDIKGGSLPSGRFRGGRGEAGRPDDAVVVGDLPGNAKERQTQINDSLMRATRDSIVLAKNAPTDTSWVKEEYVPVTSFIHTLKLNTNNRRYVANSSNEDFYLNRYNVPYENNPGDSIFDKTTYYIMKNTFAIGLLEGFNKYVPMGAKVFIAHELCHYTMPDAEGTYSSENENNIYIGGQLIKTLGKRLHYNVTGDFCVVGSNVGDIHIDGTGDLNMRILGDTSTVSLKAFYHLGSPSYLVTNYHGKFLSWDHSDFSKQMQTHLEAEFFVKKTKTTVRACYDNIQNYTYLGINYNTTTTDEATTITGYTADMKQSSANISLLTLAVEQNFRLGILNWENRLTYQKSSQEVLLAVPALNYWTNLYLNFTIAKVLRVNFGADMRWFSKYYAPEYCPQVGRYGVQQNDALRTEVGNYPIVNVYANMRLKQCRFFVMMSHVNAGTGNKGYFYTPHYPLNESVLRFGLSWDFNN